MKYTLPTLKFNYLDFEPYLDAMTMEIHYSKHHQAYVNNLNAALETMPEFENLALEEVLEKAKALPEDQGLKFINNGGGHYNHTLFWEMLKKDTKISPNVLAELVKNFGSIEDFKQQFKDKALARFGSGWTWLVKNKTTGELKIISTANQNTPDLNHVNIVLGLDVWEHAYYLKYQNRRAEYVDNWWNVVNWDFVNDRI